MLCFKADLFERTKDSEFRLLYGMYWLDEDQNPLLHLEDELVEKGYMKIQCEDPELFAQRNAIPGFTCPNELADDIHNWSEVLCTYRSITFTFGFGNEDEDVDENGEFVKSDVTERADSLLVYLPTFGALKRLLNGKDVNLDKIHPDRVIYA